MIFKSTYQILNNPWKEDVSNINHNSTIVPPSSPWSKDRPIGLGDVQLWEQIYHEPGVIGVYAAWQPKDELYLVTYNFLLNEKTGYELFYGDGCVDNIIKELSLLGIELPVRLIKSP